MTGNKSTTANARLDMVAAWIVALAMALVPGCYVDDAGEIPESGAADDMETAGRQERGRDPGSYKVEKDPGWQDPNDPHRKLAPGHWKYKLKYRDAILSPDGKKLLGMVPKPGPNKGYATPGMVLVAYDLATGHSRVYPDLEDLRRINFAPDGSAAWLLGKDGTEIARIDLTTWKSNWVYELSESFNVLDVTPDGQHLVLSNLPTTANEKLSSPSKCVHAGSRGDPVSNGRCRMAVVEVPSGKSGVYVTKSPIRDIDSLAKGELLVTQNSGFMATQMLFLSADAIANGDQENIQNASIKVPNCADEVVIVAGGKKALLSPNTCAQDPISIIDLDKRKFVKNLPGFGPVAVTPDGAVAVGFTRKNVMENEWNFFDQKQPFGLIVVDLHSTEWRIVEWGKQDPSFAISPDGKWLLAHDRFALANAPITVFRLKDLERRIVYGPRRLESFAWTASGDIWSISDGILYRGNPSEAATPKKIEELADNGIPAPVWTHTALPSAVHFLNITPKHDFIVAGVRDAPKFFQVATAKSEIGKAATWITLDVETIKVPTLTLQ